MMWLSLTTFSVSIEYQTRCSTRTLNVEA